MNEQKQTVNRSRKTSLYVGCIVGGIGLCAVLAGIFVGGGGQTGGLVKSLGNSQFRLFTLLGLGSVLGIALLSGVLVRIGAARRPGHQEGTAIIEFALVLPFLLMLILLMGQSSLLMGGYLSVNYASYCAARAAIVQIPRETNSEPLNQVSDYDDPEGSGKLWGIQAAAVWGVTPISPGNLTSPSDQGGVLRDGLEKFFQANNTPLPWWVNDHLGSRLSYAQKNTSISLDPPKNGNMYVEHEDITVKVRYNIFLAVPYASKLLAVLDSDHAVDLGDGRYALSVEIPCTLTNDGVDDKITVEESFDISP